MKLWQENGKKEDDIGLSIVNKSKTRKEFEDIEKFIHLSNKFFFICSDDGYRQFINPCSKTSYCVEKESKNINDHSVIACVLELDNYGNKEIFLTIGLLFCLWYTVPK